MPRPLYLLAMLHILCPVVVLRRRGDDDHIHVCRRHLGHPASYGGNTESANGMSPALKPGVDKATSTAAIASSRNPSQ
ncbi:MAG: hypothetical protein ABSD75_13040 [Terriglobales bacterium]